MTSLKDKTGNKIYAIERINLDIAGNDWEMSGGVTGDLGSGTLFGSDCLTRDQVLMVKLNEVIKVVNRLTKDTNNTKEDL